MFSNHSTEISLNAPSRSIAAISGDKRNHRFIVGTCALTPTNHDNSNQLNLLRYHEEMNELAIDAQLFHPTGDVWTVSSCPFDTKLVLTCGSGGSENGLKNETILYRLPDDALRDNDLDYTQDDIGIEEGSTEDTMRSDGDTFHVSGGRETSDALHSDSTNMTQVCILDHDSLSDVKSEYILKNRVSCVIWNPTCIPSDYDNDYMNLPENGTGDHNTSSNNSVECNLVTVSFGAGLDPEERSVVTTWDVNGSSATPISRIPILNKGAGTSPFMQTSPKAAWDPHNSRACVATCDSNVVLLDLRCDTSHSRNVNTIKGCHWGAVTDVDYNPNKPHVLATCGLDGLIKFWDLRYTSSSFHIDIADQSSPSLSALKDKPKRQTPIHTLRGGHTHYATVLKYNSFHDQLLLSGGSDGMVNLWRCSSISSAPLLDLGDANDGNDSRNIQQDKIFSSNNNNLNYYEEDTSQLYGNSNMINDGNSAVDGSNAPDKRVSKFEMVDAVYDLTWSAADAWVFVTVSFDGNVVLNHVPSKEKYKILL